MMKKALSAVLVAVSLMYLLASCSGHFLKKTVQTERTLTPAEKLLTLSPWHIDGGETAEKVSFFENFTGQYGTVPFSWYVEDGEVTLKYYPQCAVGAEKIGALDNGLALNFDTLTLIPELFFPSGKENAEPAEPEPTEEELLGQKIADMALGFLGWNYKYGGKTPETGFDCSGLVYYIYEQFGYRLERVAADQAKQGIEVSHDALMPGDLLAFYTSGKYVGHIGIYVGKGYYIHAMGAAYGVVLTSLDDKYSQREYTARRIIGCEELLMENITPAA